MPSKRKKKWGKKSEKRREERKRKVKVKTAVSLLNPNGEILLSAHARTSQADILHLDQKAAKCTTCKPVCGKFWLFIAWQWPENHSTSFKTCFSAKSPGANGFKTVIKQKKYRFKRTCFCCFKISFYVIGIKDYCSSALKQCICDCP